MKDKERLRNCSRGGKTKDTRQTNAIYDPLLDPGLEKKSSYKEYCWDSKENLNLDCVLGNSIVPVLNFLIFMILLCFCKGAFLF